MLSLVLCLPALDYYDADVSVRKKVVHHLETELKTFPLIVISQSHSKRQRLLLQRCPVCAGCCCSGPHLSNLHSNKIAGAEALTILDYLNEDCWQAVLDNVPVRDIIRTERASQQWQQMVQVYLSGARFGIKKTQSWRKQNVRWLKSCDVDHMLLARIGPSVVAACIDTKERLKIIAEYCPKLKFVKVSDQCVRQYLIHNNLESLEIHIDDDCSMSDHEGWEINRHSYTRTEHVTGECLVHPKAASLRTLVLEECDDLEIRHLLAATEYLQLTSLSLDSVSTDVFQNLHLVIDKFTMLESLYVWNSRIDDLKNDRFFASVCRLGRLTRLSVDFPPTDEHVEEVARCCPHLTVLELGFSNAVSGRGVAAVCAHAGAQLTSLGFPFSWLTDDDVVACIRACPQLESLDLTMCKRITPRVLPRAAAARRETGARALLWLNLMHIFDDDFHIDQKYEEIDLVLK